jgi:hypothetical protein
MADLIDFERGVRFLKGPNALRVIQQRKKERPASELPQANPYGRDAA